MKPASRMNSKKLRRLTVWVASCLALAAACDRPDYTYSDSVPITGTGASTSTPPFTAGTSTGTAGTAATNPCGLDRRGGTPAFATQAISDAKPIKAEAYLLLTDAEVAELKDSHTLVPKPAQAAPSALTNLLAQVRLSSREPQSSLVAELSRRFRYTRSTWPNPWALRLIDHPATEHMNPVRVEFKADAWFVRIVDNTAVVSDLNNEPVTIEMALAAPERIAAIYYTIDDMTAGVPNACETGRRELALGNEAMVEQFSLGTEEILRRLNADLDAFAVLFQAARPCASVDKGGGVTFHTYTVCTSWDYFDSLTEYSAYVWALSNPVEAYKPTLQNLNNLVEAVKADRFDPEPFEAAPNPVPDPPGIGGTGGGGGSGGAGLGGTSGSDAAGQGGAGVGGAADGGAPP